MKSADSPTRILESKLVGRMISIYETNYRYRVLREPEHLICRGEFCKLDMPRANNPSSPPELGGGHLCRIRVIEKIKRTSGIEVGESYIFNVASEDLDEAASLASAVHV